MISLKKIPKNTVTYCTHCDERASYLLCYLNPRIIQQGPMGALCTKCICILKKKIDKASIEWCREQAKVKGRE